MMKPKIPNTGRDNLPEVVTHLIKNDSNVNHSNINNHSDTTIHTSIIHTVLTRYSSLTKIQKILTYVLRFTYNLKNKNKLCGNLSVSELENSLHLIIHFSQLEMFHEEYILKKKKIWSEIATQK